MMREEQIEIELVQIDRDFLFPNAFNLKLKIRKKSLETALNNSVSNRAF